MVKMSCSTNQLYEIEQCILKSHKCEENHQIQFLFYYNIMRQFSFPYVTSLQNKVYIPITLK